jgi:SAM-dependent methyltransferase
VLAFDLEDGMKVQDLTRTLTEAARVLKQSFANPSLIFSGLTAKERSELNFWSDRVSIEKTLNNSHYKFFFTDFFGLSDLDFSGKSIIDVGCGPRGSLEWAHMAKERIGLDSLSSSYIKLGADRHAMRYVSAPAERIPFEDDHFDFVTSFNSLDHVDDLDAAIRELSRVTKTNGTMLLICEVNHAPTSTEPVEVTEDHLRETFEQGFRIASWRAYATPDDHQIYDALRNQAPLSSKAPKELPIIIAARMVRLASTSD